MSNHESLLNTPMRRWYDQEPACSRAIEQIRTIQYPLIQDNCAQVMVHLAERIRKLITKSYSGPGLSMGLPGLKSLYLFGKEQRRWYDERPDIQKAVGCLYRLTPQGLSALGFKLGDTFGMIRIYTAVCNQLGQTPQDSDVAQICKSSLQDGPQEAEDVMINIIGKELYESLIGDIKKT